MADDLYATFNRNATRALNDWQRNFVIPYGSAYTVARDKFKDTLDAQKKADEERRQRIAALAMFALSLCGGSILTHVFGSAAAQTLAGQFAVDFICKREMNRAFKVASFVSENKTAQFAIGKVWDAAADLLPDLKTKLAETTTNFPSLTDFAQNPQVLQNHLWKWVLDANAGLLAAEEEISKNIKDEKTKTRMIMDLIDAPFVATAPAKELAKDTTAEDIEFSFYMNVIRSLDYLAEVTIEERGRGCKRTTVNKGSIDVSPTDSAYPKPARNFGFGTHQTIEFNKFGSVMRDRVDELHKKRFNKTKFFTSGETISENTLRRAEQKLTELSNINVEAIRRSLNSKVSSPYGMLKSKDWKSSGSFPAPR
jgi:predicted transcriptional regulator